MWGIGTTTAVLLSTRLLLTVAQHRFSCASESCSGTNCVWFAGASFASAVNFVMEILFEAHCKSNMFRWILHPFFEHLRNTFFSDDDFKREASVHEQARAIDNREQLRIWIRFRAVLMSGSPEINSSFWRRANTLSDDDRHCQTQDLCGLRTSVQKFPWFNIAPSAWTWTSSFPRNGCQGGIAAAPFSAWAQHKKYKYNWYFEKKLSFGYTSYLYEV